MKTLAITLAVALSLLGLATTAVKAAGNDTQTVTYEVGTINEITVSGDPGNLTVNAATAGSEPDAAVDSTTTYSITTNGTGKKITGGINTAMPTGTTLKVNLTAPTGGTSAGAVTLSGTAANLVTVITKLAEGPIAIEYTLTATVAAGVVSSAVKTVTLTIADGS